MLPGHQPSTWRHQINNSKAARFVHRRYRRGGTFPKSILGLTISKWNGQCKSRRQVTYFRRTCRYPACGSRFLCSDQNIVPLRQSDIAHIQRPFSETRPIDLNVFRSNTGAATDRSSSAARLRGKESCHHKENVRADRFEVRAHNPPDRRSNLRRCQTLWYPSFMHWT